MDSRRRRRRPSSATSSGISCASTRLWFSLGSIGSTLLPPLPGVGAAAERLQQEWRRAAEFSCDRAALLVTQDAAVVSEALIKLASGSTRAVDVDAYLQQAREYDEALEKSSRFVRTMQGRMLADATHPLPIRRVAELDRFARSAQFADPGEGQRRCRSIMYFCG